MIAGNGLRSLIDSKVDFSNTKNLLVVSITLGVGLGLSAMSLAGDITSISAYKIMIGNVEISALAISTLLAILLNIILPNYKEENNEEVFYGLGVASGINSLDVIKDEELDNKETINNNENNK